MGNKDLVIGIVGAGKLGIVFGNLGVSAGYKVYLSSSRPVEEIKLTIDVLVPGAVATTNEEINKVADIIILALPLSKFNALNPDFFGNKIILDAMNYWWEVDGVPNTYSDELLSSSEHVARHFNKSRVVKAFNHIGYHNLVDYANQSSTLNRKALLFATDHQEVVQTVEDIINDFGFNPFFLGSLKNGRILEAGRPLFGATLSLEEITPLVAEELNKL